MKKHKIAVSTLFPLDSQYSTTRYVTFKQPEVTNKVTDKIHSVLFLPDNPERVAQGGLRTQGYFKSNQTDKPLMTVITVVFNGVEYLEQTIISVIEQSYDNVEYIIIDGGSTDGTLDIIKKYENQIDYWVSERDEGISDAFNKGLCCVTGQWVNILNAGDYYASNSLFSELLDSFKYSKIITGYSQYSNSTQLIPGKVLNNDECLSKKAMISHQASFVSMSLYKEFGGYSKEFKVRMDYDFWCRVLKENSFNFLPKVFVNYLPYGESYQSVDKFIYEGVKINFNNMSFLPAIYSSFVLFLKQSVKFAQRKCHAAY